MRPLSPAEAAAIEANLFPAARPLVRRRPDFPWHRDRAGDVTASAVISSQALAVDFFETVDTLKCRDAIVNAWAANLHIPVHGPWSIELEAILQRDLLGERRPTQVDVLARSCAGIVLFECKFTEQDGGGCSQPIPIARGRHTGVVQCNSDYAAQVNPVNGVRSRCALTGKGIRYWDLVGDVLTIDSNSDHRPCPFAGGWFQWMRNLAAARALGRKHDVPTAVVVVYADGPFPMAGKVRDADWTRLEALAAGRAVPFRAVSYQSLHAQAVAAAGADDQPLLADLGEWVSAKLKAAASGFDKAP